MAHEPHYRITLAKEDFKFSSAHFTLFPDGDSELLHGHNYQVMVELAGDTLDDHGLLCDIAVVKKGIRAACAAWDSLTLIPQKSPELDIRRDGESIEVRYQERLYLLPARDVVLLPLANTSIELLARWLWKHLGPLVPGGRVSYLAVTVAETAGQSCRYGADL